MVTYQELESRAGIRWVAIEDGQVVGKQGGLRDVDLREETPGGDHPLACAGFLPPSCVPSIPFESL